MSKEVDSSNYEEKVLEKTVLEENAPVDTSGLKASVVFSCGTYPTPLLEISKVAIVRNREGIFMPAVKVVASGSSGAHEVSFPYFMFDVIGGDKFDEARRLLHTKINEVFDGYKANWIKDRPSAKE